MNRLGMIVDVSHLSDQAVAEVLKLSTVPVIASHSAFRHFTPGFERNISDELAIAVAAKGGVIQIPFGIAFVNRQAADELQAYFKASAALAKRNQQALAEGKEPEDQASFDKAWQAKHPAPVTQINAVLDQFDYAVKLIGIDHVGIGSDFDGVSGNLPVGLKTVADYPNVIAGLQARGYTDEQLSKLLGGNLLRVWTAIEKGAQPTK
jgi:membrane dipeptidase